MAAAVLGLGLVAPVLVEADRPGRSNRGTSPSAESAAITMDGLAGLELPDLPSSGPGTAPAAGPSARQVVVQEGDCLWRIAERRLPPNASAVEVASLTWRLYALNRSTIGDDPDLIQPGMALIAPEGAS